MDNEFEPRIEKDREITKNTIQYLSNRFTAGMVMLIITTILVVPPVAQSEELMGERIAVVSAFAPELEILKSEIEDRSVHRINGIEFTTGILEGKDVVLFLSGISMVNAAMTVQLALDQFNIRSIVFSGIAGGVDPNGISLRFFSRFLKESSLLSLESHPIQKKRSVGIPHTLSPF